MGRTVCRRSSHFDAGRADGGIHPLCPAAARRDVASSLSGCSRCGDRQSFGGCPRGDRLQRPHCALRPESGHEGDGGQPGVWRFGGAIGFRSPGSGLLCGESDHAIGPSRRAGRGRHRRPPVLGLWRRRSELAEHSGGGRCCERFGLSAGRRVRGSRRPWICVGRFRLRGRTCLCRARWSRKGFQTRRRSANGGRSQAERSGPRSAHIGRPAGSVAGRPGPAHCHGRSSAGGKAAAWRFRRREFGRRLGRGCPGDQHVLWGPSVRSPVSSGAAQVGGRPARAEKPGGDRRSLRPLH